MATLTVGACSLSTGSASAVGPGGAEACPVGDACLYYNSPLHGWGSWEDWSPQPVGVGIWLYDYKFAHYGNGSGYGQIVHANAAAIVNNTGGTVEVTSDSGATDAFGPYSAGQLTATYNSDLWLGWF